MWWDCKNGQDLDGGIGIVFLAGLEIWRDCEISPSKQPN